MEVALCGCDPFPCVESGQYDQRAVKEDGPRAEVIWQGHVSYSGCKARWGDGRLVIVSGQDWESPMQLTVKGKNTTVPEKVRTRAERKLAKLQRFDNRILAMDVEFSEERNPRVADPHRVEVTLTTKSGLVRAHANAIDPAAAVDQVIDRLERQVKKLKGRRVDRTQHADGVKAIPPLPPEPLEDAPAAPRSAGQEPEGPVGGDETDQAKVVYRRPDGVSGPDEPEP
jgi:ribosomal subunit interface protein